MKGGVIPPRKCIVDEDLENDDSRDIEDCQAMYYPETKDGWKKECFDGGSRHFVSFKVRK